MKTFRSIALGMVALYVAFALVSKVFVPSTANAQYVGTTNDVNAFVRTLNGYPSYLGRLTSAGTSIRNDILGTPFTTAKGYLLLAQCDAAAHVNAVASAGTVTTTNAPKVRTTDNFYVTLTSSQPYVAMIPDSGSANCDVWKMIPGTYQ